MQKFLLSGLVLTFAVAATVVSSQVESTASIERSSLNDVYGATCYQHGNLSKKYCSFWCGYSAKVQSVVEAPEAGSKKNEKPCSNSTTCTYKKPELDDDACSWGGGDPGPIPDPA